MTITANDIAQAMDQNEQNCFARVHVNFVHDTILFIFQGTLNKLPLLLNISFRLFFDDKTKWFEN